LRAALLPAREHRDQHDGQEDDQLDKVAHV
jgi:hypothetical protein